MQGCHAKASMSAVAVRPLCGLCKVKDAARQVEAGPGRMMLACSSCSLPIRRALALGCSMEDVQAEAAGTLDSIAARISFAPQRRAPAGGGAGGGATPAKRPRRAERQPDHFATPPRAASNGQSAAPFRVPAQPPAVDSLRLDSPGVAPARAERSQDGTKVCNLCPDVFRLASFPASGDRVKPYCMTCMPYVRKGIQAGVKVQTLREWYQHGGLKGVQENTNV
jgi:hypothetical protein